MEPDPDVANTEMRPQGDACYLATSSKCFKNDAHFSTESLKIFVQVNSICVIK